jgi:hypothetical protein
MTRAAIPSTAFDDVHSCRFNTPAFAVARLQLQV